MKRYYFLVIFLFAIAALASFTVSAQTPAIPVVQEPETRPGSDGDFSQPTDDHLLQTTWAITRTEDTDPLIAYTGAWTVVTNQLFTGHTSNTDYTESSTPGDSLSFDFTGSWLHLGFASDRSSGQVEVLVDGISQGTLDLYTRDVDVTSFVMNGFSNSAHTLSLVVAGTSHPNASDHKVKLDYIDTWDGTLMPDGSFEENNSRVWTSADWSYLSEASASGGAYAQTSSQGDNTAWFPFTGDTLTFHAVPVPGGNVARLLIDGQPLATLNLYNSSAEPRSYSFEGLGTGPHVLTVRHFLGAVTMDAFSTPGSAPFYEESNPAGIVRYEEYSPAIQYNGFDFQQRPQTWAQGVVNHVSMGAVQGSDTAGDTISFDFDGPWVNLGFRTRTSGGLAEVSIDGINQGTIGLYSAVDSVNSFQYGGLSDGSHTLIITVSGQPDSPSNGADIFLDYIDVWDGESMPDGYTNVRRGDQSGRLHFSTNVNDYSDPDAYQGDYASASLPNGNNNIWYAFTGDAFTYLGLSHPSNSSVEIFLDDVLLDTVDQVYPFSQQPLTYHYTGFDNGPHVVRIHNVWSIQVDAFASNPSYLGPYQPIAEWWESDRTAGASIWGGLHVPAAVGDVTGDGDIELVVASSNVDNNGELFLMNGDGSDSGDGTPILWSIPYNIFNGFEDVGAPAIVELDGQPGAEIIHPTASGLFVYHHDGSTYWMTDTLKSHVFFSAPAAANLDLDPEPEIAVNLDDTLAVFENDGTLAWQSTFSERIGMPLLADVTGDGSLDILFHDSLETLYLYEYNLGSPTLTWTQTFTTGLQIYGSPAIADIDGQQPGGDPDPEIVIASNGWLNVLQADGSPLWSTQLDSGSSGGVAIGDLDGDGEVEIVTSMLANGGRIYAVNADGSLLWSVPALDNSPISVSLFDLEGDGTYEVAWNGADQGLTLFDGTDGTVLFNEPHLGIVSTTGSDYPVFADVDLDGFGEFVVASHLGVRVFGFDGYWGPARSQWNQHSYHITNIDDDLTIPADEPNSWEEHNTYRAQFTPGTAQFGLELAAPVSSLSGIRGETIFYTLVITNTGNRTDTYNLDYSGNQWDVHLLQQQITLAAGENDQFTVEVTIPMNAADGQTDSTTLTATSQADSSVDAQAEIMTTVHVDSSNYLVYFPLIQR